MKLSTRLAAAIGIPLALASAGCAPSPEDIAAQQAAVATLMDRANDCPTIAGYQYGEGQHHQRLQDVLNNTRTSTLQDLAAMRIKVCMDQGLAASRDHILGVFHEATGQNGEGRLLRLADNGEGNSLAAETMGDLAYRINDGRGGDALALQQSRLVMVKPIIYRQAPNWYGTGDDNVSRVVSGNAALLQAPPAAKLEVATP